MHREEPADFALEKVFERKTPADWQLNTHISLKNRYVFFQVSKAASSTVVHHLQSVEFQGSHFKAQSPNNKYLSPHLSPYQVPPEQLIEIMQDPEWRKVAFVRNPYTRVLSCYLHRIVASPASATGRWYRRVSGDTSTPTFSRFVEYISRQPSVAMEQHWRVQADEVLDGLVELTFVGRVERLQDDLTRLSHHLFGSQQFHGLETDASPMRTRAALDISDYYTEELAAMVVERYRSDFSKFGYSTQLPLTTDATRR